MPTYEYKCNACEHRFELFQSMKDSPKRKCPECGKNALERLIGTGAAVIFKGSGFYQTDYRSESYKKAAEAEKKSASESTSTTAAPAAAASGTNGAAGGGSSQASGAQSSKDSTSSSTSSMPAKKSEGTNSGPAKPAKSPKKSAD